ncbi:MAG: LarC family nickel insertion protein [Candidatus Adiutrix sp.]|jgi:uncharacterized protein (DUF111 family)|nr:LarC family nickel insertion protein [Candidatus Adiutrix sp.]
MSDCPLPPAILVIRPNSGLSGDMLVAGLLALAGSGPEGLAQKLADLNLSDLVGRVSLIGREVSQVSGVGLEVNLPEEHQHRNLTDIEQFFAAAAIPEPARALALKTFGLLAEAEGAVHGLPPREIHFHEVGALDSLLDIGLAALLLDEMAPARLVCGPLPLCDGVISCRHGLLPAPAPAVLRLLEGVPVVGLASRGETVTPTALALLKAAGAEFGPWPALVVERQTLAYGARTLPDVPNGAIFVLGRGQAREGEK